MKTFTKGSLTTVVDDDDFRIDEYKANGWKETKTADKPKDEAGPTRKGRTARKAKPPPPTKRSMMLSRQRQPPPPRAKPWTTD